MPTRQYRSARWLFAWLVVSVAMGAIVVRVDIAQRREVFQSEARTAHRLLSQRASQHDAILATLVLLDPELPGDDRLARLPALYPQVLQVWRRPSNATWHDVALAQAEPVSRGAARPVVAAVDSSAKRYDLLLAGLPASFALRIELNRWVPWSEWPFDRAGPVEADLVLDGHTMSLQPGIAASGWYGGVTPGFVFDKALDTPSQPFVLHVQRATGPADWPWPSLLALATLLALALAALAAVMSQRAGRRRAEQLLRLGRTARLNALGELAAGMAHELNQPLTAVIASTQAARRLLDDEPLPQATLREALGHASDQARRAAEVVARLRRRLDRPGGAEELLPVPLGGAVHSALALLQPELQRLAVRPVVDDANVIVRADPVALEQILHNLLNNALQALAAVPAPQRTLRLMISTQQRFGILRLRDDGPGLAPQVLNHLFEPFSSTRADGLGLGLSLCHSLAMAMGGTLSAQNVQPHGAEFRLELPLAES
ncbi:MAG: GHKL domain-containing protein [Burkholderiaceae bacterium]|nr:GHKL domain-containing protein [Burkholderiaceae bacterium]